MSLFSFIGRLFGRRTASGPQEDIEIYVGNLSYSMTSEQLRKAFAKYGRVTRARVVEHRQSGRSKGFGFVIMPYRAEAEAAIAAYNGKTVMGRELRVNEARNALKQKGADRERA